MFVPIHSNLIGLCWPCNRFFSCNVEKPGYKATFCFICFVHLALLFEKFIIRSLNLLRQILRCENYNPPRANLKECKLKLAVLCSLSFNTLLLSLPVPYTTAVPPPGVMEAHQAKLAFFKASTCQQMLEHLVGHYLPLSAEELKSWDENSEDFGLCSYVYRSVYVDRDNMMWYERVK